MSCRQIKPRLAMWLPGRNKIPLLNNRPCSRNPASRRFSRIYKSLKISRTLAGARDPVTPVAEARAPGKLLQNHLEPGAALLDHRQLPTHLRLRRQDPRREHPRHLKLPVKQDNAVTRNLKEAHPVVSGEIEH